MLDCELTISFLDLELRSVWFDPEGIVILCLLDHDGVGLGWFLEVDGFVRLEGETKISYTSSYVRSSVTFTAWGLADESAGLGVTPRITRPTPGGDICPVEMIEGGIRHDICGRFCRCDSDCVDQKAKRKSQW